MVATFARSSLRAVRRRAALHGAYLHRRGVGPQQQATPRFPANPLRRPIGAGKEKGVVSIEGGVILWKVEGKEIQPLVLDFGPDRNGKPQAPENLADVVDGFGDGMIGSDPPLPGRHGEVDGGRGVGPAPGHLGGPGLERRFERRLQVIDGSPVGPAVVGWHLGQPLEQPGDDALFPPQHRDPLALEPVEVEGSHGAKAETELIEFRVSCRFHSGSLYSP